MCTTCTGPPSKSLITEDKFSTTAVDKTVEKAVRIHGDRCHAWAATQRLQKQHRTLP